MNLFTLLKQDHREAKSTLKDLAERDFTCEEATEICTKLSIHMEMEEKYLYPVMEKVKGCEDITEEAYVEHAESKKIIKELLSGKLDDVESKVKMEMLQLGITHHANEEEEELFPQIKDNLTEGEIAEICEKMTAFREKKLTSTSKSTTAQRK